MLTHAAFQPAWWLTNPHLQTIYPAFFRPVPKPSELRRERINTPDNDFIDLDWCGQPCAQQPLILMLHGLAGSSDSPYIRSLQHIFQQHGWASVTFNFRGCSGESNNTSRCYHSGETADLQHIYTHIRQRHPDTPIAAIGFSLGGNMLLKWLGEQGHAVDSFAAVAISVPFLLDHCATKLDSGFSRLYNQYLLYNLKQYIHDKRAHLQRIQQHTEADILAALGNLRGIHSFWQYDQQVISALYGFKDVHDYYQQSSSRQFLHAIRVPTLIIQAADDPFMTPAVIPDAHELSDSVTVEVSERGGHVGFVTGENPLKPKYWLDERIPAYIANALDSR